MSTCPICGKEASEDARFCTACGASLGPVPAAAPPSAGAPRGRPTPPPVQHPPPPPRQSALPIILAVLAMIVAAIVIIAAIGAWFVVNEASSGDVALKVNSVSPYSGPFAPGGASERVVVNATLSNNRSYDLPVGTWWFFSLETNNGTHRGLVDLQGNCTVPANIPAGRSKTFSVVFDIPRGAAPVRLTFDNFIAKAAAGVP